jgi:hypothetical protein
MSPGANFIKLMLTSSPGRKSYKTFFVIIYADVGVNYTLKILKCLGKQKVIFTNIEIIQFCQMSKPKQCFLPFCQLQFNRLSFCQLLFDRCAFL